MVLSHSRIDGAILEDNVKIHVGVARANKILIKILNKNRHTHSVYHQILCVTKGQHFDQYHKKAMA